MSTINRSLLSMAPCAHTEGEAGSDSSQPKLTANLAPRASCIIAAASLLIVVAITPYAAYFCA